MLEPFFFQMPDPNAWQPGLVFRVLGYARVDAYTLVKWRFGGEDEYSIGETLYRDRVMVVSGGGSIPLVAAPAPPEDDDRSKVSEHSVWKHIDPAVGAYGIPPAIAMALRDPRNYVCFDPCI